MLPTYEGVCRSELYQLLKQLLPSQAEFPHTFTLAQLLLRAPCSPLLLAVRFGRQAAARALVAATLQSCGGGSRSKDGSSCAPAVAAEHLGAALAHWPLAGGEEPTGLAIDAAKGRLYVGCGNQQMIVMDAASGTTRGQR